MRVDNTSNHIQFAGPEAMVSCETERLKPELAGHILALDMHMRRLVTVEAREEDPIRSRNPFDSWHSILLLYRLQNDQPAKKY